MKHPNFTMSDYEPTVLAQRNSPTQDSSDRSRTQAEIQAWIVSYLAQLLEVNSDDIDIATPFDRYGLDSSAAVGMTGDLEDWLNIELEPTLVYDYPTIKALTQHLAENF